MKKTYVELMAFVGLLALAACSESGKMAGVTEDDNAFAQNVSSSLTDSLSSSLPVLSSSSPTLSSSSPTLSSSSVAVTPKLDLWNGADGIAKINTDNEMTGYWYSFSDYVEGGMSTLSFPVQQGNEYSGESYDVVVDACGGMCGTIKLSNAISTPWVGDRKSVV